MLKSLLSRSKEPFWLDPAPRRFDSAIPLWVKLFCVATAIMLSILLLDQRVAVWADTHRHLIPDLTRRAEKGDLGRELMHLEQWGQFVSTVMIVVAVGLIDPAGRRRAFSIGVGCFWTVMVTHLLKDLIGRSRPFIAHDSHDGHWVWGGPMMGFAHGSAWGSFPSAHTSSAFALAAGLAWYYPRARPLFMTLACITATLRVLHTAHYVSDVIAGMVVGVFVMRGTLALGITGR